MQALQMAGLPDIGDAKPLSESDDHELISDIISVLRKHGALSRFGLNLLHKHFELEEGEILLESTDVKTREQWIKPVNRSGLQSDDVVVTQWRFDTGEATMHCHCMRDSRDGTHLGTHVHIR